jgi:hypothetical protein
MKKFIVEQNPTHIVYNTDDKKIMYKFKDPQLFWDNYNPKKIKKIYETFPLVHRMVFKTDIKHRDALHNFFKDHCQVTFYEIHHKDYVYFMLSTYDIHEFNRTFALEISKDKRYKLYLDIYDEKWVLDPNDDIYYQPKNGDLEDDDFDISDIRIRDLSSESYMERFHKSTENTTFPGFINYFKNNTVNLKEMQAYAKACIAHDRNTSIVYLRIDYKLTVECKLKDLKDKMEGLFLLQGDKKVKFHKFFIDNILDYVSYKRSVFRPGPVTDPDIYNTFKGFKSEPKDYDIKELDDGTDLSVIGFIRSIICDGDENCLKYILSWLKHCRFNATEKIGTSLVLVSKEGAGKNTLFEDFFGHLVIGKDYTCVANKIKEENSRLENKCLVIVDEGEVNDKEMEMYKRLITGNTMELKALYKNVKECENYLNFIFLANKIPFIVDQDKDNRRFSVLRLSDRRTKDIEFFKQFRERNINSDIANKFAKYLEKYKEIDIKNPFRTRWYIEQVVKSENPVVTIVKELIEDDENGVFVKSDNKTSKWDGYKSCQAVELYSYIRNELIKGGYKQSYNDKQLKEILTEKAKLQSDKFTKSRTMHYFIK